jgi:hypothetical protein
MAGETIQTSVVTPAMTKFRLPVAERAIKWPIETDDNLKAMMPMHIYLRPVSDE